MNGQGNLERAWKVREFENRWLWQAVVQEGKGYTFSSDSLNPASSTLGATLKGR